MEFVKDPETKEPGTELVTKIRKNGFKHGIIFGVGGMAKNVLKIKPPLIISTADADTVLKRFDTSLKDV